MRVVIDIPTGTAEEQAWYLSVIKATIAHGRSQTVDVFHRRGSTAAKHIADVFLDHARINATLETDPLTGK